MSAIKLIHKAIQDILDKLPNHSNKVYLLEDYEYGMRSIHVMYDTYYDESKTVYIDRHGMYIQGRGQGQGDKSKMYLKDFEGIVLSEETEIAIQSDIDEIVKKLDTRIPSKDIKVGMICNQYGYDSNNSLYVGKVKRTIDYSKSIYSYERDEGIVEDKVNVYVSLYGEEGIEVQESYYSGEEGKYRLKRGYFKSSKSKIRFDKIVDTVDSATITKVRNAYEHSKTDGYMTKFEWID